MTTPLSTIPLAQDIGWTAGTITGRIKAPDGTVGSPGIQFRDDPNTGMRRAGADSIGLVTGGVEAIQLSASSAFINVPLFLSGLALATYRDSVTARTSDATLSNASGGATWQTNTGAAGEVILTLPSAATTGVRFMFAVDAAQYLRVKAAGTDTIRDAGTVSAAAGYIRANVAGNVLEVTCIASGKWYVTSKTGTWTVDS